MKHSSVIVAVAVTLWLAVDEASVAQTSPNSMLYSPNVNLSAGSQNGFVGTVGGIFLTTYSFYPQVNWLGYYDANGDGLANSHVVTLWDNSTQNVIASATVPAGTAAPLINGYRWVQLPSTVNLNYGSYYVIGAQRADQLEFAVRSTWRRMGIHSSGAVRFRAQLPGRAAKPSRIGRHLSRREFRIQSRGSRADFGQPFYLGRVCILHFGETPCAISRLEIRRPPHRVAAFFFSERQNSHTWFCCRMFVDLCTLIPLSESEMA